MTVVAAVMITGPLAIGANQAHAGFFGHGFHHGIHYHFFHHHDHHFFDDDCGCDNDWDF